MPKVSVLIPAYNYADYLPEAIESVLNQTFGDFELLVVDNCSTDNTEAVCREYMNRDPRVKYFKNSENIGMYRNYNQSLLHAQGSYIKFLNADDKFHPELLERFVSAFETYPTISLVTSFRQYFGSRTDILKSDDKGFMNGKEAILKSLASHNWIGEPTTVMFKRENLTRGLFDTSLLMFADYDMWLRQLQGGDIFVIDEVLSYFRIHAAQGTNDLNSTLDKRAFSFLQLNEYKRFALQTDKFGYNFQTGNPKESNEIFFGLAKESMKYVKYAFAGRVYSPHLKRFAKAFIIDYIFSIPKKTALRIKKSIAKRFKK